MAFKMRENSLFAILLRNSSWYSFLIGAFVIAIAFTILKPQHAIYAIAIAVPFFCIGGYRAFQEARMPSGKDLEKTESAVRAMSARQLVAVLSAAYAERGYEATVFKGNGADLRLEKEGRMRLLASKRVKAASTGVEPLEALVAAGEAHDATYLSYLTFGELSGDADAYAREHGIDVIDLDELAGFIGTHLDKVPARKR